MQYMNNIVTKKRNKEIEISGKKSKKTKHVYNIHGTLKIQKSLNINIVFSQIYNGCVIYAYMFKIQRIILNNMISNK